MPSIVRLRRRFCVVFGLAVMLGVILFIACARNATAGPLTDWFHRHFAPAPVVDGPPLIEVGGEWHWIRSPDQDKAVAAGLFNRYCIRCHGVDGRGVWDIPGVPDFSNPAWQATRTDAMYARRIIEGRGAVMPTFRGMVSLEEAWALARYIRTLVPPPEGSPPVLPPPRNADTPKK
jgi:cytochrome c553